MATEDMKVDGNAIGGLLGEIFALEMTSAAGTCAGCGAVNELARVDVYVQAPGTVVRCPACGGVLLRIVSGKGRYWVDMSGLRCIELAQR